MTLRLRIILAAAVSAVVVAIWLARCTPTQEELNNIIYLHNHPRSGGAA